MDAKQTRQGVLLALAAYFIWGIAPAYFKLIYYVPADEILTHRVIWSFFFMVALLSVSRQWRQVKRLLKTKRQRRFFCWPCPPYWSAVTGYCSFGR